MTRLWYGVDVGELCDTHLLGEHSEMHQEVGTWKRHPHGRAVVRGHVERLQVLPELVRGRHDELAGEMARRGMNHESPLEDFDTIEWPTVGHHDESELARENRERLAGRCQDCADRMEEALAGR